MSNRIYVIDWAPYRYLVDAMLRVKPVPSTEVLAIDEMPHPACTSKYLTEPFVAFTDEESEPAFTVLGVAEALDRKFNANLLCGESPEKRGIVRSITHIMDEGFSLLAAGHIDTYHHYRGPIWHERSEAAQVFEEGYAKKLAAVDRCCGDAAYLLGDRPYLPDVILAAACWFAEDCGLPPVPGACGKLAGWVDRNVRRGPFVRPAQ